ncbi:hypothetical protein Pfo_008427 [Paulownia fortunei]|nr:hypothetical protein Pfo_008427 [Paulownia fortunei]
MKILCSAEKIGGVIGKGGLNARHLQQETGASIHVENVSRELGERVIYVTSFEAISDQVLQTINAVLHLQNKTSEYSDEGSITTRLLVPLSKVGCILGQGGLVINEMRRRTHANICVSSTEDKPKCATEDEELVQVISLQDEELVQITGSFGVAKDVRPIRDCIKTYNKVSSLCKCEPGPDGTVQRFGPAGNFRGDGLPPSSTIRVGSSGRYEHLKFAGTRMKLQDPYSTPFDFVALEPFNASQNMHQSPASSAGLNNYPQPSFYATQNMYQTPTSSDGPNNYCQPGNKSDKFNGRGVRIHVWKWESVKYVKNRIIRTEENTEIVEENGRKMASDTWLTLPENKGQCTTPGG